ncbi:hypothetical protein [Pseudoxanthomonas suwonensis]|uniref:hypothetical protein n=1 Tax=Pseudoxanthomonas suwonensis TaxID=314722 RepID=UPI001FE46A03|nr:hypothetical protein [Pseudoxanthomonas suwonensis]
MEKQRHILLAYLGRSVLLALVMATPVALLYADIQILGDSVGEWSLVELTQIGFLVATVLAFVRLARAREDERGFAVLAAGFFGCMLIRELDAVWDLVFRGLWPILVAAVASACLGYALRRGRQTLAATASFLVSRSNAVMTIGLVLLLVYSRLFGMTTLWHGLLAENYVRVFKNAAEECTELLGYSLIMAAALTYAAQRVRERRRALAGSRQEGHDSPLLQASIARRAGTRG